MAISFLLANEAGSRFPEREEGQWPGLETTGGLDAELVFHDSEPKVNAFLLGRCEKCIRSLNEFSTEKQRCVSHFGLLSVALPDPAKF